MKKLFQKTHFLLVILVLASCKWQTNPCSLSNAVLADIKKNDSITQLPAIKARDSAFNKSLNEPSLINAQHETYRFIWSSSFDGTKVFRVEKVDNQFKAIVKEFDSTNTISATHEFVIPEAKWTAIEDTMQANAFWIYPSRIERQGFDGTTWQLEGYKPFKNKCTHQQYHQVSRWSPIDTPFIKMCMMLFDLKGEK